MYLPRVGSYRCHPVPTSSRVDDKFHRLVTVADTRTLCSHQQEELVGSLTTHLEYPQLAQGQSRVTTRS